MENGQNDIVITGRAFLTAIGEEESVIFDKFYDMKNSFEAESIYEHLELEAEKVKLVKKKDWDNYNKTSTFRRLPSSFKYALYVVDKALKDAEIDMDACSKERVGVFFGTGLAAISSVEKFYKPVCTSGIENGSPLCFPNTTSSVGCGLISMANGFTGKSLAISSAGVAGMQCVDLAMAALEEKELDYAIIVGTDEITETVFKAFYHTRMLGNTKKNSNISPYNIDSGNTTVLGEGAAAIILEHKTTAEKRNRKIYAKCNGVEEANINIDEDKSIKINAELMKRCISNSGLAIEEIDVLVCSGNGNAKLDICELEAIKSVFRDSIPNIVLPSLYFGETDGASGVLNLICALDMIDKGEKMELSCQYRSFFENLKLNIKQIKTVRNILVLSTSYYGDLACTIISKEKKEK